jgi:hypothetical protein
VLTANSSQQKPAASQHLNDITDQSILFRFLGEREEERIVRAHGKYFLPMPLPQWVPHVARVVVPKLIKSGNNSPFDALALLLFPFRVNALKRGTSVES